MVGKKNPKFKSILHKCDYCSKEYYIKPYKRNISKNLFCSDKCRVAYFSDVYSKTDSVREASRERALKMLEEGAFSHTETKPQKIINCLLDSMGIEYINEKKFDYYAVDNYLTQFNLIIEVMGDFWHCNPIKYSQPNYKNQRDSIRRDAAKRNYLKDKYGINVLYLWESDIYNNLTLCQKLIDLYINNCGVLDNYNSFNYSVDSNGELKIKDNVENTYFELKSASNA